MYEGYPSGYCEKIHRYQELLSRRNKLEQVHRKDIDRYYAEISILKYLKENDYLIDPKFVEHVKEERDLVQQWLDIFNGVEQLYKELNPGNFRHVVYSLSNEIGSSLEELAETLGCSSRNALVDLCEQAVAGISEMDYQKVCGFFKLNTELWRMNYVFPRDRSCTSG